MATPSLSNVRAKLDVLNRELAVRKASRSTIFISELKDEPKQNTSAERRTTGVICKAVTLSGAPCKAKASCGAYCKRHFFVSK